MAGDDNGARAPEDQPGGQSVTHRAASHLGSRSLAAERMRRMRERKAAEKSVASPSLLYERADWQLFIQKSTLPQVAGCSPDEVGRIVIKELFDNALDENVKEGPPATIETLGNFGGYRITDHGRGIDRDEVLRMFAVNRPLRTSKLVRLPTRGMLGNGLRVATGAVAAHDGKLIVTSKGRSFELRVNQTTGDTEIIADTEVDYKPGTTVEVWLPIFTGWENIFAGQTLAANRGIHYNGPSHPAWYSIDDLHQLFTRVTPASTSVAYLVKDAFGIIIEDQREAGSLDRDAVAALHKELLQLTDHAAAPELGYIGPPRIYLDRERQHLNEYYCRTTGVVLIAGASIPYTVETWVKCKHAGKDDPTSDSISLLLNRSSTLAPLSFSADSNGLHIHGCGLNDIIQAAKRGQYTIRLSLITPYVRLTNNQKTPFLGDFRTTIIDAIGKAAREAYRMMRRPVREMSIKDAAYEIMEEAYLKASDNGKLPANARQIMYAARPLILEKTNTQELNDKYFTQVLLPDYVNENPDTTADWDVVYDARGHLIEPHTGEIVPMGTIEVRAYLGKRAELGPSVELQENTLYPTSGPDNRYRNVVYIEKEGFDPLLRAAQIPEKFDMVIISNKGMSVTATRALLDELASKFDNVFVLHDFDVSGFSIAGTLATSSRRYKFAKKVPIIDIGLRLIDVERMGLESESVKIEGNLHKRAATLARRGATEEEINFLLGYDDDSTTKRVELNAMTSRQMIDFLEAKFAEHGVKKVVPDDTILAAHMRRIIEAQITRAELAKIQKQISAEAEKVSLPDDMAAKVRALLTKEPTLSWDQAVERLAAGLLPKAAGT